MKEALAACCALLNSASGGGLGSVLRDDRLVVGAVGHPAAGKGDVAAWLWIDRQEFRNLAVTSAVSHRDLARIRLLGHGVGNDAASVVALHGRNPIGPRGRAHHHSAHGNQAGGQQLSHLKTPYRLAASYGARRAVESAAEGQKSLAVQVLPPCT